MNIIGIGTDIVDKNRISRLLKRFGQRFIERILSEEERKVISLISDPTAYLAKRFAAKEAVAKALGTGIGAVTFNEISILNATGGKPYVKFEGKSKQFASSLNIQEIMISLSDEKECALAFAVIVGIGNAKA
ncbi:MAG: hypothetical protein BGO43_11950 [Gammaproteobacteria bacterium 39-13]|nr:holo-ACP synthase [Gammaproteobacteria bacterium]OJV85332.1 MAG: hypothetical protein BGO43_11950 [Gammaproteobacteria bacterium 39-13]